MKYKSYVSGLRWAGLQRFLKKYCYSHDLEITMDVDSGLIRETVYFTVVGESSAVEKFKKDLANAVNNYNSE
jgi:hypothetical protein